MGFDKKVAIVYQAAVAPERDNIIKPMKPGGYSDSGADIAYSLKKQGIAVIYPVAILTSPGILIGFIQIPLMVFRM